MTPASGLTNGLVPGWARVNAQGYGTGGTRLPRCTHGTCRNLAVRKSTLCHRHDTAWQANRRAQIAAGKGRPPSAAEIAKAFRAQLKALWDRNPWHPGQAIWFAPGLEARFVADCRPAGFDPELTAPVVLNNLRWAWWRSRLNHDDPPGWERSLAAGARRRAKIGLTPETYLYLPPPSDPPPDARIKTVHRRAACWEPAGLKPPIDRTTRSQERHERQDQRDKPSPPANVDWHAVLYAHWRTVFLPLFKAHRLDLDQADGPTGQALATAYAAVLDEQAQFGDGSYGPAQRRWHALLRDAG